MTRRRSSRSRRNIRLRGAERGFFILGATLYVVGLLGGLGLLAMPATTAIWLLVLGGGLQFIIMLSLIF